MMSPKALETFRSSQLVAYMGVRMGQATEHAMNEAGDNRVHHWRAQFAHICILASPKKEQCTNHKGISDGIHPFWSRTVPRLPCLWRLPRFPLSHDHGMARSKLSLAQCGIAHYRSLPVAHHQHYISAWSGLQFDRSENKMNKRKLKIETLAPNHWKVRINKAYRQGHWLDHQLASRRVDVGANTVSAGSVNRRQMFNFTVKNDLSSKCAVQVCLLQDKNRLRSLASSSTSSFPRYEPVNLHVEKYSRFVYSTVGKFGTVGTVSVWICVQPFIL